MNYAANNRDLIPCFGEKGSGRSTLVGNRPGVLRRILNLIVESRQNEVDRDIARFLIRSGGRLTDDMEREMTQRLFKGNWNPHQ